MGRMNEAMRAEIEGMSGEFSDAEKADGELNFKAGKQKVYIPEYRWDRAKKGANAGKPIVIVQIKGAEKRNKNALHDLVFTITTEVSRSGQFHREKLKKFLLGFGIKSFNLTNLDDVLEPMVNKVFEADIDFDKNDFISVKPIKVVGDKEIEEEAGGADAPF